MFQWYKDAQVCYAYLIDVPIEEENHERSGSAFRNSEWFTRGWTLQELLAPETVVFFNQAWDEIGTKRSLNALISSITNIDEKFLDQFDHASVAQKFSWASSRQTLRVEDTSYCLMGLFGVNMPLLYGEGNEAFIRLQLEIMKVSHDDSLFAWAAQNDSEYGTGLLAESPAAFQDSGHISMRPSNSPYSMTNKGLKISLTLIPASEALKKGIEVSIATSFYWRSRESDQFIAPLNCFTKPKNSGEGLSIGKNHVALLCGQMRDVQGGKCYTRLRSDRMIFIPADDIPRQRTEVQIFFNQGRYIQEQKSKQEISKFEIRAEHFFNRGFATSWIIDDCVGHLRRSPIETWRPADGGDPMRDLVLELGRPLPYAQAFVEFKDMNSYQVRQEAFVLMIYRRLFNQLRPIGIDLLEPSEKSLYEVAEYFRNWGPQSDRATMPLQSGRVVSAALRKRERDGELIYAVYVDIK
jgi:hypothetical protein